MFEHLPCWVVISLHLQCSLSFTMRFFSQLFSPMTGWAPRLIFSVTTVIYFYLEWMVLNMNSDFATNKNTCSICQSSDCLNASLTSVPYKWKHQNDTYCIKTIECLASASQTHLFLFYSSRYRM